MVRTADRKTQMARNMYSSAWGLPVQMVSMSEKESNEWKYGCMDFMDYQASAQVREKRDDLRKARLLSGEFDMRDYSYVRDPLSVMGPNERSKDPAKQNDYSATPDITEKVQHYPLMVRPINTIIGEYIKRIPQLHGFYAKNESHYARNEHLRVKTEMLQEWAKQQMLNAVIKKVNQQGIKANTPEYQQAIEQQTPEEIQEYMDRDYIDVAERVTQTVLRNMWKTQNLDTEFIEGFKSACIWAKEFYHIYSVNKKTRVHNISPLDVFYHKSPSVKWVADGQFAGFRWFLTPSSIIDMYYDDLTVADMEEIQEMINPTYRDRKSVANSNISYDTQSYTNMFGSVNEMNLRTAHDMISDYQRFGESSIYSNHSGLIKVVRAYWKSVRQVGWLTTYDENDQPVLEMVDENYEPKKNLGEHVDFTPCNQIYTGVKIGTNVYLDIGPYDDQIIDLDNLEYTPLPIDGCTYNDTASKPYSLVDLMTPWNELYNIVAHELKEDMNSAMGKVMFMSIDHMPTLPGFTMKKWYYWARKFKIAWVKQPTKGPNNFNQFTAADMDFANSIAKKMEILERIKMECDSIAGFSPNRVASQSQESTLGQSNQQLTASVNQTEYLFFRHAKLIERILNQAYNTAKKYLKDNTFMRNLFDDYELAYIDYDADQVINAKIGIYITNSSEDQRKRAAMESLMQPAMQNGADFADMSELIMAETISEVRSIAHKLRRNAKAIQQSNAKQAQDQIASAERIAQMEIASKEKINAGHDRALIQSSAIRTYGGINASPSDDADGDGMPDMIELLNLDMKQADMFRKYALKGEELNFKKKQHQDTLKMDEKQLAAEKERTEMMARKKTTS